MYILYMIYIMYITYITHIIYIIYIVAILYIMYIIGPEDNIHNVSGRGVHTEVDILCSNAYGTTA